MNRQVPTFKITAEDLRGDSNTIDVIQQVLEPLNYSLNQIINIINSMPTEEYKDISFDTGVDTFPIKFTTTISKAKFIALNIQPKSVDTAVTPWNIGAFTVNGQSVSISSIPGLAANTAYNLRFLVKS